MIETNKGQLKIWRITALWGFSEAAFGGILHALNIPFRGIFISGAAVIFISLIAFYSSQKNDIIKAAVTVILIKAMVSPHSPVTAYLAVFIQGLTGQILFYKKSFFKTSALLLGIITGLYSGFQKLIVLTIIYGTTLWKSIDEFMNFIVSQFSDRIPEYSYSLIIAVTYIFIHITGGIFFGILAGRIPFKLHGSESILYKEMLNEDDIPWKKDRKGKRKWWKRPSYVLILSFSIIIIILSYITPLIGNTTASEVAIMLLRSIVLMFLWYRFLSPLVLKFLHNFSSRRRMQYSSDISKMVGLFPGFRRIISYVWSQTALLGGIKRIREFLKHSFIILLNYEEDIPAER